jgi:endonuclease/exonuclease/phosphatase family metal-dependent hydrolase
VSFNILNGRSPTDAGAADAATTERLVQACASLEADVLCLQEVDRNQARSAHVDQAAEVAKGSGAPWWRFEPALIGEPGGRWRAAGDDEAPDEGAGYGIAMVCRSPVKAWHVVRMAAARVRSPVAVPGARRLILLPDEPRVALAAEVDLGSAGTLVVATTHLSFVPGWNALQLRRLTRALAARERPCVLLGDLNLPGPFPRWASGWRPLARMPTFPADEPSLQLDHALAYGAVPEVVGVESRRLALSDHRALILDLAESR